MRCPACKGAGFKLPDDGVSVFGGLLTCATCNGASVVDAESNDEPVTRLERLICAVLRGATEADLRTDSLVTFARAIEMEMDRVTTSHATINRWQTFLDARAAVIDEWYAEGEKAFAQIARALSMDEDQVKSIATRTTR